MSRDTVVRTMLHAKRTLKWTLEVFLFHLKYAKVNDKHITGIWDLRFAFRCGTVASRISEFFSHVEATWSDDCKQGICLSKFCIENEKIAHPLLTQWLICFHSSLIRWTATESFILRLNLSLPSCSTFLEYSISKWSFVIMFIRRQYWHDWALS